MANSEPDEAILQPDLQPTAESAAPRSERVQAGPESVRAIREARTLLRARPQHGADGRFVPGNIEAGCDLTRSEQLWALVDSARQELAARVRAERGIDEGSIDLVDNYVEVRLIRESLWGSLLDRGGPITAKGNSRRILDAYFKASDRERDRHQLLPERQAKRVDLARALSGLDR